jgi:hypothetical protein
MFCPSCGKEIPDDSRYCLGCGKSLGAMFSTSKPIDDEEDEEDEEPERKSHSGRNILIGFIVLLGLYLGVMAVSHANNVRIPGITTRTEPITPPNFIVNAGTYYYFGFTVDGAALVAGRFEANGGSGNDIEAFITDADNFENWKNGHQSRVNYQSGRATVGNIELATSRPGTYYLVFNNRFSLLSNKAITSSINLIH